jgi:membrane fusion protein, multidrug efflux system
MIGELQMGKRGLTALGIVAIAAITACSREAADAKEDSAPNVVAIGTENVAIVTAEMLASGPAVSGTLVPEREAAIRAQLGGPVLAVLVDQGSAVRTGALLARIDDHNARDAYLSARSAVTTAQTTAERAKRDLERSERLAAAGAIAERDLEQARWSNTAAESQLADAQARLSIARKQMEDAQVKAPFNGVVSARTVSTGDIVTPGAALFTVVDPSSMRYEAAVPAQQLSLVRVGAPVSFTVSGYPGRRFEGKVTRINPVADQQTGQVKLVVSVPNSSKNLVGGLFADGRVASERRTGLTAPFSAVDVRGVQPSVLRLKDGKAERVNVELGVRDEERERYEIVKGVAAGDTLLTGAAQGISPGALVRVSVPSDRPASKN